LLGGYPDSVERMQPEAVVFDAFGTLFDLDALRDPLGDDAFAAFKARLIPWMWHLTASERFVPLPELAELALEAVGADPAVAEELKRLPPFPDVEPALDALDGTPLAILSNGTRDGLRELVANAGLSDRFSVLLAADEVQAYKPSPAIYELAQETFGIDEDRLLLVSAHEWDVAGARANGMRTAWVARGREPSWVLRGEADAVVEDLGGVAELANRPD
jgi:2-haloacid dehalogenase